MDRLSQSVKLAKSNLPATVGAFLSIVKRNDDF
jgi:hypothetical protein